MTEGARAAAQHSLIQWLGPELGRGGWLKNEHWVPENCEAAEALFSDGRLRIVAGMMAAVHPRSLDYIRQAPVLVAGAARGTPCDKPMERGYVITQWLKDIENGPKLRDLFQRYKIAPQLRALKAKALRSGHAEYVLLQRLQMLPPMMLAQSIPSAIRKQDNWLRGLMAFRAQMSRRFHSEALLEWAAFAMGRDGRETSFARAHDVADFAGNDPVAFNQKWTWAQAEAAEIRWREMLARQSQEEQFLARFKLGWSDPIDYGALPLEVEIDGFTFVALNSGAELFSEGHIMRHCVASYTQSVVKGRAFIFSIRVGDKRHATLEISHGHVSRSYRAMQLKGPCNAHVSAAIRDAVGKFMRRLNRADTDPLETAISPRGIDAMEFLNMPVGD